MAQRREGREVVLQALYANEIGKGKWEDIINSVIKPKLSNDSDIFKFAERLFLKIVNNQDEIDDIIQAHLNNWRLGRLNAIDRLLLRIAIAEFLYYEQIPTKVSINEAIEIAKKYSTKKSGNFINGILDSAREQLNNDDRINKKGRGLIESSFKS
ncbi:transcription antitermination factor NusB [Aliifodinibius salipaludis]|uniref:Transcription antitermination protein NusB n=1 Tax=Fodinibius salipaludis TaxID=2032627 RepID=A0A2A2GFB5_9BACT|nr:transcription antitermination factor NusB [Aliifodinibius salipaludis]PAU95579.1 transcription antitermination factor NusB [Aliifodinibius salipaludis]